MDASSTFPGTISRTAPETRNPFRGGGELRYSEKECIGSRHWILAASVPRHSYKYRPSKLPVSQHRSWAATTRDLPLPIQLQTPLPACINDRSNVSNQLRNRSGIYVLKTPLLSLLEARHLPSTASQRSTSKGRKKTCTRIERDGHASVSHHRLSHSRASNLSSLFPFLCLPTSFSPRLLQAFFRHPPQHDSILNLISLTFASSMTIPSMPPVGTLMHSAAQSIVAFHRMRHTWIIWAAHYTQLASSPFTRNSFKMLFLVIPTRRVQGSYRRPRL